MKQTAQGISVLDCGKWEAPAEAAFQFSRVQPKFEVVRMLDADEIRQSLPLNGVAIAGTIGGELARGRTLDVGLLTVGARVYAPARLYRQDLPLPCREATHFVKTVWVGAFAMNTAARANVRAAAEILKIGAQGQSSSEHAYVARDGDLASCDVASPAGGDAPKGCAAPLRVELEVLDPRSGARAACEEAPVQAYGSACVSWLSKVHMGPGDASQGELAAAARIVRLACEKHSQLCMFGRVDSKLRARPELGEDFDRIAAEGLCQENASFCVDFAEQQLADGNEGGAMLTLRFACGERKSSRACGVLADMLEGGVASASAKDKQLYVEYRAIECAAGSSSDSCTKYAQVYKRGGRPSSDFSFARRSLERCISSPGGCSFREVAALYFGLGVARDVPKAKELEKARCRVFPPLLGDPCGVSHQWE